ncbi:MAG: hypothetical protein ACKOGP_10565 [Bacteroidota bacterium]
MTDTPERKDKLRKPIFILSGVSLLLLVWAVLNQSRISELNEMLQSIKDGNAMAMDSVSSETRKLNSQLASASKSRDSLESILAPLQPYRSLVGMLMFRDSMQSGLPFKPGDKVLYVPDSLFGVVREIRIAGAGPSFNLEYMVVFKGGIEKSVPALLLEPSVANR